MHISIIRSRFLNGKLFFWITTALLFLLFFFLFSSISFPFLVGFILAYLFAPFVDSSSKHINRSLISAILAIGSIYIFIAAGIELLPRIKDHLLIIANNMPVYYDRFISFLDRTFSSIDFMEYKPEIASIKLEIQKYLDQKVYILASIIGEIASRKDIIGSFFSFFVIMPVSFFYFLRDWNTLIFYIHNSIPKRQKYIVTEVSSIIRSTFSSFLHGQFYVAMILSVYYVSVLWLVGIKSYIYMGIISGLFSFIPFIGAVFSCILTVFVSTTTLNLTKFYIILATYSIGQLMEGYILSPKFVGKRTGLHPLWILFSFSAGIQLGGVTGVLLAIPLAAVIRNLIKFAIGKFKSSQIYKQ
ncbi:MAG: AI-2E family transporter [Holosporaceae bacterium]|jgi:predicted PurR-regulated permease PerM|nr:AI-2E family transporter [Holosporaceae bacterium]